MIEITARIGSRFRVKMTLNPAILAPGKVTSATFCEWEPDVPKRLRPNELGDYRRARHAFFAAVAEWLGHPVTIVDPQSIEAFVPGGPQSTKATVP